MSDGLDIGALSGRIELEDRMSSAIDLLEGKLGDLDERFGGFGKRVAEAAAGFTVAEVAIGAIKEAAHLAAEGLKEIFDVALQGAKVADVSENFERLTQQVGRLGSTLLNELREGTHNTISDFDLMKSANDALAVGVNITDKQYKELATGAFALAQAKGMDVKQAFDAINEAMITGRTRGLMQLDVRINQTEAEEKYAAKLKTTADHLTEEGKLEAVRAAIMEKVGDATKRLGEQTDGLDELLDQAKVGWQNFLEEEGKAIATSPVIMTGLLSIRDALVEAFGGSTQELVKTVTNYIEDLAIGTLNLAEYVTDAVGVIGVEWNAAIVVFESVKAGWAAIFYVVESGVGLALEAIDKITFGALGFGEAVTQIQQRAEGWYNTMAEGQNSIEQHKKAEEEWAVATGNVKDKIEQIRQKMIDAKETQNQTKESTDELAKATNSEAAAAGAQAAATDKSKVVMEMTKEEAKKFAEAMKELENVTGDYKKVLETVDGEVVEAVKYYLDAGVALDKLATAYGLTETQAKAIERTWKEGNELIKEQTKAAELLGDAWKQYYEELADLGATDLERANNQSLAKYEDTIKKLQEMGVTEEKFYDDAWALYQKDVDKNQAALILKDTHSKAFLESELRQAEQTYRMMQAHSDQYSQADIQNQGKIVQSLRDMKDHWSQVNAVIDKQTEMVRTLSGEVLTLKEYEARQAQGGSFNVNIGNFASTLASMGISNTQVAEILARKGYSFQQIVEMLRSGISFQQAQQAAPGNGPRIPGFAQGGIGDFGEGTLAVLHGHEAIIPLPAGGSIGNTTLNFYVNGTAEESARKISDIIMRQLKSQRQFGAA